MKRFSVRLDPLSFELCENSLIVRLDNGTGEAVRAFVTVDGKIRNGECGRRQPFDQLGLRIGNFEEEFPILNFGLLTGD